MTSTSYKVNESAIVAEMFDTEAIVMNLTDGVYYTLSGTAAEIWSMIEAKYSVQAMAEHLSERHGVGLAVCTSEVTALLAELLDQSIILDAPDAPATEQKSIEADFGPYATPVLTRHDDMAEVMAMDPPLPELTANSATSA